MAFQARLDGASHLVCGQEENRAYGLVFAAMFPQHKLCPSKRPQSWALGPCGRLFMQKDFNLCSRRVCARLQFLSFVVGALYFVFRTLALVGNT